MMFLRRAIAACIALLLFAPAVAEAKYQGTWLPGGTPTGQAGMHHLLFAHPSARSGLTFAGSADVGYARNMFFASSEDRLWFTRQTLHVTWTLDTFLEIGLGALAIEGFDAVFSGAIAPSVLPSVHLAWHPGAWQGWAGGLAAYWQAPPLSGSSGLLSPVDSTYSIQALGSRALSHALELTVNLGYIYDRSGNSGSSVTNPVQLFVDGRDRASRMDIGVGLTSLLPPIWRQLAFGPYAELTSEWALHTTRFVDNPVRLTVGSKLFLDAAHAIEADVGVDIRIIGSPRYGSVYAGLPPWSAFLALSWHSRIGALDVGRQELVYVRLHDAPKPTVVVSGFVRDANALVLADARLHVVGDDNAVLGADPNTGHYQSMPLTVYPELTAKDGRAQPIALECSAPGYVTQRQMVQPPPNGGTAEVDFHLERKPPSAVLHLRVLDGATGAVVPGTQALAVVDDDEAGATPLIIEQGEIRTAMHPGPCTLIVSAPGYAAQRFKLELNDDSELILHVALRPKVATPKAEGSP